MGPTVESLALARAILADNPTNMATVDPYTLAYTIDAWMGKEGRSWGASNAD